ncbi:MAG TPA: class I SAM-dependent methyltransferase [Sphingomicrobium sp.]
MRPCPADVDNFRQALAPGEQRVLLLGVTPELSVLGKRLTAVDNSPRMLANVWPGDSAGRRAILADWTDLPFAEGSFDAVIGDASLNAAPEQVDEVLQEVSRVLAPRGKVAIRLFCAPDEPETLEAIAANVAGGWNGNFHALKWRIAMSLASSRPRASVPVREILEAFNATFPDRDRLAADTGWPAEDISTIDAYIAADHSLGFPTLSSLRRALERHFADISLLPGVGYPLAERCPTVICSR